MVKLSMAYPFLMLPDNGSCAQTCGFNTANTKDTKPSSELVITKKFLIKELVDVQLKRWTYIITIKTMIVWFEEKFKSRKGSFKCNSRFLKNHAI